MTKPRLYSTGRLGEIPDSVEPFVSVAAAKTPAASYVHSGACNSVHRTYVVLRESAVLHRLLFTFSRILGNVGR